MGTTHFDGLDAVSSFAIGGTAVTSTAAELNILDGVGAGTVVQSKAVVVDANKDIASFRNITYTGSLISSSGTISAAEFGFLDGVTAGAVTADKAVVVDSSRDIATLHNVTYGGSLINGSGTISAAEINTLDGMVNGVTYTIGSEVNGGTITINCQFTDAGGSDMAVACALPQYVSSVATGLDLASAPSGGVDNGSDGEIIEYLADQAWLGISEADGDLDIVMVESGDNSFYLVTVLPTGRLDVSDVIDFD